MEAIVTSITQLSALPPWAKFALLSSYHFVQLVLVLRGRYASAWSSESRASLPALRPTRPSQENPAAGSPIRAARTIKRAQTSESG